MKKRIKIQGFLVFLSVAIILFFSKIIFPNWKNGLQDEFFDAIGIILVLFGFLFRIVARGYKEQNSQAGRVLVKNGPYGLIRHPMYFGTLLIGIGIILVLFKFWVFPIFLIIYVLIYLPQINREEKILLKRFGQEYISYCKTTPKYFPKIPLNFRQYLPLELSWIRKELLTLIAVIVLILAIEIWRDVKLFGYQEFYKELVELLSIIVAFIIIIISFTTFNQQVQRWQ
ncbi:MAG: isoprenylcysteine carboxylmethyltransferase family protein [Candidatus Omnitrophica bacterium]|nr:isoprenylcysteine carboxylmethyltransferase family protein [Candidatus Omnitrophota bacterium]